jgi:hypothetical protein
MNDFDNLFPRILYHSYIVEGDPEITSLDLRKFLEERGEVETNSPDVLVQNYDAFTIDDSHKIKEWHSEMGVSGGKRICIIGAKFINHDAERTLLKIIEEPAVNTHFFLVVPNSLILLDTIRSRTHIVSTINNGNNDFEKVAKEFISATPKNRIDLVGKIIKENKDEESSGNLRFVAIQLINEIEKVIFEKFKKNPKDTNLQFILEELQKNREFLNLPGASVKMILEHLALVI